jgi:hypothetical protein
MVALLEFASLFLLGIVSGVSFSHLLQRGPKKTLPAPHFLAVQQVLIRNYGPVIGGLEVASIFSTLTMAIVGPEELTVRLLAALASACVLIMVTIWALLINPINKTVNSWTPESLPANWADFRDRWHFLHTTRLLLSAVAFSAVIAASLR